MKKNVLKKLMLLVLSLTLIMSATVPAMAYSKDVTKNVASKSKIKTMVSMFETKAGYDLAGNMTKGKTVTLNFKKNVDRKAVLGCTYGNQTTSTLSKWLFGKSTSSATRLHGDWDYGYPDYPEMKISKIYKTGKYTYRVDGKVNWVGDHFIRTVSRIGTFHLYLTKENGSHYGYVATKISYKKTV